MGGFWKKKMIVEEWKYSIIIYFNADNSAVKIFLIHILTLFFLLHDSIRWCAGPIAVWKLLKYEKKLV